MSRRLATMNMCSAQIPIVFPLLSMHVLCCGHFHWRLVTGQESTEGGDELRHDLASRWLACETDHMSSEKPRPRPEHLRMT